jgi:hypothetical protein
MKTVEQQMVVMQAYVDGKTIKRTNQYSGEISKFYYEEGVQPNAFNWSTFDYDIVKEPIVKYMIVTPSGDTVCDYPSYETAKAKLRYFHSAGYKIIKLVQDIDFKGDE